MPEGFKGFARRQEGSKWGGVWFIGGDWKGGKDWSGNLGLAEGNWRGCMKNREGLGNAGWWGMR